MTMYLGPSSLGNEAPFDTGWKAGAAPALDVGGAHGSYDLIRRLTQRFPERGVAAIGLVHVQPVDIRNVQVTH